ncbi:hypothetical protein HY571_00335 [Candidatus Micrarchaeota archaeon]|nr:hypothetical protein [Candidatus Micrarchaeota archaeon]
MKKGWRFSDEKIHSLVAAGLRSTGLTRQNDWRRASSRAEVEGRLLRSIFYLAQSRRFFGHGSWENYLKNHHGVDVAPLVQEKSSGEELHSLVRDALKAGHSPHGWLLSNELVNGVPLERIYRKIHATVVEGRTFFGTGSWLAYLAKHHNLALSPRREKHILSEPEIHQLVRDGVAQFGRSYGDWPLSTKIRAVSVSILYKRVRRGIGKNGRRFFGHGNWKNYVEWLLSEEKK